jgi:hypothetical protein
LLVLVVVLVVVVDFFLRRAEAVGTAQAVRSPLPSLRDWNPLLSVSGG